MTCNSKGLQQRKTKAVKKTKAHKSNKQIETMLIIA